MKPAFLLLCACCVLLSACDPVSERDCGVFDHPDLAQWQADTTQGVAAYMNSAGQTIRFTREAVVLNEPFLGTDGASNDEDVVCNLQARVRLVAADNSLAITSVYTQPEALLLPSSDEPLVVNHVIEKPVGIELDATFSADISIDQTRLNIDPTRVIYLEEGQLTEEIGGQAYEDVVRINTQTTASNELPAQALPSDAGDVAQIVIARQFGIVAFSLVDDLAENNEFVLLATP